MFSIAYQIGCTFSKMLLSPPILQNNSPVPLTEMLYPSLYNHFKENALKILGKFLYTNKDAIF